MRKEVQVPLSEKTVKKGDNLKKALLLSLIFISGLGSVGAISEDLAGLEADGGLTLAVYDRALETNGEMTGREGSAVLSVYECFQNPSFTTLGDCDEERWWLEEPTVERLIREAAREGYYGLGNRLDTDETINDGEDDSEEEIVDNRYSVRFVRPSGDSIAREGQIIEARVDSIERDNERVGGGILEIKPTDRGKVLARKDCNNQDDGEYVCRVNTRDHKPSENSLDYEQEIENGRIDLEVRFWEDQRQDKTAAEDTRTFTVCDENEVVGSSGGCVCASGYERVYLRGQSTCERSSDGDGDSEDDTTQEMLEDGENFEYAGDPVYSEDNDFSVGFVRPEDGRLSDPDESNKDLIIGGAKSEELNARLGTYTLKIVRTNDGQEVKTEECSFDDYCSVGTTDYTLSDGKVDLEVRLYSYGGGQSVASKSKVFSVCSENQKLEDGSCVCEDGYHLEYFGTSSYCVQN